MTIDIRKLKVQASEIETTLWIGKSGVTDSIVEELKGQLASKRLVKVKILKSALEARSRQRIANDLEVRSGAKLIDIKGSVAVYLSPYRTKRMR